MALRAVLIGCGNIGSAFADDPRITDIYTHAGAWSACADVELAAVCDANAERAQRCARRWQVAAHFTDVGQMLDRVRPELVSICTPDATHAAILAQVLATPGVRGVLAEKPLALSCMDGRTLVAQAEARGIVVAVNYSRRYARGQRQLAQRVRDGLLGELRQIRGCYTKGTLHNGTHWIDWARMFAGEIAAVRGFDALGENGDDPTLDARLEFAGGAVGTLTALDHRDYSLFEIDLLGSRGRLRIFDSGHRFQLDLAGDSPRYSGYRALLEQESGEVDMRDTLLLAAGDLLTAVAQRRPPLCSAADALETLAVAEAARLSAKRGGLAVAVGR
ncbi:MAG: Gfo/Idh/MocA family oxidoreductase [Rhodocyclaceae bacterium]|nr:Gfo/Idh/MocA family oxidoreductase [Rhodocyclaceae bacterium]